MQVRSNPSQCLFSVLAMGRETGFALFKFPIWYAKFCLDEKVQNLSLANTTEIQEKLNQPFSWRRKQMHPSTLYLPATVNHCIPLAFVSSEGNSSLTPLSSDILLPLRAWISVFMVKGDQQRTTEPGFDKVMSKGKFYHAVSLEALRFAMRAHRTMGLVLMQQKRWKKLLTCWCIPQSEPSHRPCT